MAANLPKSTVELGRLYELLCIQILRSYSFQLVHTGRAGDKGVDFIGSWVLPTSTVPVVGQCKNWKAPLNPVHVREFEGTVGSFHARYKTKARGEPVVGLLLSNGGFTEGAVNTVKSSGLPLVCCHLVVDPAPSHAPSGTDGEGSSVPEEGRHQSEVMKEEGNSQSALPWRRKDPSFLVGTAMSSLARGGAGGGVNGRTPPPQGRLCSFVSNLPAQSMFPGLAVATASKGSLSGVTLLHCCPADPSRGWDIGSVRRRLGRGGPPVEWGRTEVNEELTNLTCGH